MAIARLAETLGANNAVAGNYDVAVAAPASTPNAVCVLIGLSGTGGNTDLVTSVTYGIGAGAVPLTERRWAIESTEPGGVYLYWAAGVTFPAGAQTVRIARTGTTALRAAVCPMTCAAGQQIAVDNDTSGTSASVANPSWSMVTLAGSVCYEVLHSGLNTMTTTPATNWTLIGSDDIGNFGRGWAYRVAGAAGDQLPGWIAATADDYVGASVAFKEVPLAGPAVSLLPQRRANRGALLHL